MGFVGRKGCAMISSSASQQVLGLNPFICLDAAQRLLFLPPQSKDRQFRLAEDCELCVGIKTH